MFTKISHHRAADTVHRPFNFTLDLVPVRPPFRELIDFLRAEDAVETIPVRDDGRQLLCVRGIDQVDLRELAEGGEELEQVLVFERLYIPEIEVHVAEIRSVVRLSSVKV